MDTHNITLKYLIIYKNSSRDAIANVNLLRRYRTRMVLQNTKKRTYFV